MEQKSDVAQYYLANYGILKLLHHVNKSSVNEQHNTAVLAHYRVPRFCIYLTG